MPTTNTNGAHTTTPPRLTPDPSPDNLTNDLAHNERTLADLASSNNTNLDALAALLANTQAPARQSIDRLAAAQSALLPAVLGRAKIIAARRLRELAETDEHPETARKAAVDLLKLTPGNATPHDRASAPPHRNLRQPGNPDAELTTEAQTAVRNLLESLAQTADDTHPGPHA